MAQWELQNGKDPQLLNTSHSIVTTQTQEIAEMQQYLPQLPIPADCTPAPAPNPSSMVGSPSEAAYVLSGSNVPGKESVTWELLSASCHLVAGYGGDDNVQHAHAIVIPWDGRYEQWNDHGHEQT